MKEYNLGKSWGTKQRMKTYLHFLCLGILVSCTVRFEKAPSTPPRARPSVAPTQQTGGIVALSPGATVSPAPTAPIQFSGPGKTVSFEELQKLFAGKMIQAKCCEQKCCEKSENVDRHRISCSIDPKNPLPTVAFETFLISCVSTDIYFRKGLPTTPYVDTILTSTGEKFHFSTQEAEAKILALNPQASRFRDDEHKIFLNCKHAESLKDKHTDVMWQRSRQMFLEINNCAPRGKAYEAFVIEKEADRLSDERKYDESRLKAMEGCDKGDAHLCYIAGTKIPMKGEAGFEKIIETFGRACRLKHRHACDTEEVWAAHYNKYKTKKATLGKKCNKNDLEACKELVRAYRMHQMNLPAADEVSKKLCKADLKDYCLRAP
jgi:hypothetical protein